MTQTTKTYAPKNRKKFHNRPRRLQHEIEQESKTTLEDLPEVEFLTSAEMNNLPDDEQEKYQFDGDASAYRGYMCFRRKKEYGGQ